jgi:hypothetical protein
MELFKIRSIDAQSQKKHGNRNLTPCQTASPSVR